MSFEVVTTPNFDKEAKRLSKRWPSLKADLGALFRELAESPRTTWSTCRVAVIGDATAAGVNQGNLSGQPDPCVDFARRGRGTCLPAGALASLPLAMTRPTSRPDNDPRTSPSGPGIPLSYPLIV